MNKKVLVVFILGMVFFSLAGVSAVSKVYDEETKTINIKDTFLFIPVGDRAQIQLKTDFNKDGIAELHAQVPISPDEKILVAEFEVRSYKDYKDALKSMKFYDKKKPNFKDYEIQKDFEYRYKVIYSVEVPTFEYETLYLVNGTAYHSQVQTGTHFVERERWENLTKKDYVDGDILTIGIFTTTEKGEYVEWIPTDFFGVDIPEFASWSASLDSNLISYWNLDDSSGNLVDEKSYLTMTPSGTPTYGNTGILNEAIGIDSITDYFVSSSSCANLDFGTTGDFTINFWIKGTTTGGDRNIFASGTAQPWYRIYDAGSGILSYEIATGGGADRVFFSENVTVLDNTWHMVTMERTGSGLVHKLYVDKELAGVGTSITKDASCTNFYFGDSRLDRNDNILLDNFGAWAKGLTNSERIELFNDGLSCGYDDCVVQFPTITLNSPANDTTTSNTTIEFNGTISDNAPLNVSLIIDGTYNETNTSGILGDYLFTKTLEDGIHTWNYESCDVAGCSNGTERTLTIDTTPFIEFLTPPTLVNYANITQEYIPMKVNVSTNYYKNNSFDIYNINGTSFTQFYTDQTYDINFTNLPDSHYHYNATICTTTNQCNSTETRHINHDTKPPEINISSPTGESNYIYVGQPLEINFTSTDIFSNISSCSWNYNGTNNSIACSNATLVSVPIAQEYGRTSANVYSNDTFGNTGFSSTSWTYKILEIDKEFNNETTEGAYEIFTLNLNEGGSAMVQSVVLHYNGQTDNSSLFSSGDNVTAISELLIDGVSADTNKTFYFTITLTDSTTFNTTSAVQLVHDITIDDCSANPYPLLYLYLKDEEARTTLSGTIETNVEILNNFNYAQVLNISQEETGVSYVDLCSNVLLNETDFLINAEIRYNSGNHSAEFYHIQKAALADYPINLSLFDLKTEDTTIFKVLYRNQDLIGVEGAVLQLQRKYISDGIYEVVEAPLTSSDSSGILHIDTNTNKYQITVVKDGEVLGLFQNLVFICESELTGECTINLYDKLVPPNIVPLVNLQDFSSAIETSIDDQTITLTYVVPSGTAISIQVLAIQHDTILGDSVICNQTIISSAGSIECAYATTIQDSKITYQVFKSGELIAEKGYVVQEDLRDDWGGANYILLVILMLSLVFMALSSPEWVVINAVIVVLLGGGLWLIRGIGFVEGLGSLMWLIVGAVILISKLAKQEDY